MPTNPVPTAATGLPEPQLIEPYVCTPQYADGLASVEIGTSGNVRLTLYAEQRDAYEGRLDRVVTARIVIPKVALMDAVAKIMAAAHETPAPTWASQEMGGRA